MKRFGNAGSPYPLKVRITLHEKGLAFEQRELRHHAEREELLRLNPRGEVSALQDGDTVLYDSTVIRDSDTQLAVADGRRPPVRFEATPLAERPHRVGHPARPRAVAPGRDRRRPDLLLPGPVRR